MEKLKINNTFKTFNLFTDNKTCYSNMNDEFTELKYLKKENKRIKENEKLLDNRIELLKKEENKIYQRITYLNKKANDVYKLKKDNENRIKEKNKIMDKKKNFIEKQKNKFKKNSENNNILKQRFLDMKKEFSQKIKIQRIRNKKMIRYKTKQNLKKNKDNVQKIKNDLIEGKKLKDNFFNKKANILSERIKKTNTFFKINIKNKNKKILNLCKKEEQLLTTVNKFQNIQNQIHEKLENALKLKPSEYKKKYI